MHETPPETILYVHASDELYGSDLTLLQLIRGLDRRRFRPIVVLPTDIPYEGHLSTELRNSHVECLKIDLAVVRRRYLNLRGGISFGRRLLCSTAQLVKLIRRQRVVLVHSNTIVVWSGGLAALLTRRPHVWQIHEIIMGPAWLRWMISRSLLVLATAIVTNSYATQGALFGSHASHQRVSVIHNGVELPSPIDVKSVSLLRKVWGAKADDIVIGTVGRVSYRKGQQELLQAAETVVTTEPGVRFVIIGGPVPGQEDWFEEVRSRVESSGLVDKVVFTGFCRNVSRALDALDLVVVPVIQPEPFGLAAAEALAHGKPVIASRLGGLTEIVVDGETGLLVPAGDITMLAKAITRLVADKELRKRLGEAGQARIANNFTLQAYIAKITALYTRLLS